LVVVVADESGAAGREKVKCAWEWAGNEKRYEVFDISLSTEYVF